MCHKLRIEMLPTKSSVRLEQERIIMDDEQMKRFVSQFDWIFAKTYAEICPHEYIVKTKIDNSYWKDFEAVVEYIRHAGFEASYNQRIGKYYVLDVNYYWIMGDPISDTIILNRAKLSDYHLEGNHWIWKPKERYVNQSN